ncbi:MAG TPA: hypothetical protein V6C65_28965, partial [Allocoleopsis sp.]
AYLAGEPSNRNRFDSGGYNWITSIQRDLVANDDQISFWGMQLQEDGTSAVVKAKFENGNMVKTVMSAAGASVYSFATDSSGNLIYGGDMGSNEATLRSSSGKYSKLTNTSNFWTTKKGHINIFRDQASDGDYAIDQTTGAVLQSANSPVPRIHKQPAADATIGYLWMYDRSGVTNDSACATTSSYPTACSNSSFAKVATLSSTNVSTAVAEANQSGYFALRYDADGGFIVSKEKPYMQMMVLSSAGTWTASEQFSLDIYAEGSIDAGVTLPFVCRIDNLGLQINTTAGVVKIINEDTFDIDVYGFKGINNPTCFGSWLYAVGEDEKIYGFNVTTRTSSVIAIKGVLDITNFKVGGSDSIAVEGHLDDGSKFFGTVNTSGDLTVISKLATGNISIIAPLN